LIVLISWHNDRKTLIYKAKFGNTTVIQIKTYQRDRCDREQRIGEAHISETQNGGKRNKRDSYNADMMKYKRTYREKIKAYTVNVWR
jgi:hypothetical protein